MYKTPAQIARTLRAFRNAHRLELLRSVCVSPGRRACDAGRLQYDSSIWVISCPGYDWLSARAGTVNANTCRLAVSNCTSSALAMFPKVTLP